MPPDLDAATVYALDRLASELPPALSYHSVAHTRDDVAVAAVQLAEAAAVDGMPLLLLQTAAYFHDLGFVTRYAQHEEASVAIASAALPGFGYRPHHIRQIAALIRATRLPQRPGSFVAQLLADADLDVLGRSDFLARNRALRQELAYYGQGFTDRAWYTQQLAFISNHRYWTAAARGLRDPAKRQNQADLAALLAGIETPERPV